MGNRGNINTKNIHSRPTQLCMGSQGPGGFLDGTPKHIFSSVQLQQLRVQIMEYRLLARNQPLTSQMALAVQGKRIDSAPHQRMPQQGDQGM